MARNEEHITVLRNWLEKKDHNLKHHKLRKGDKWQICRAIYRSSKISLNEKEHIYESLYTNDVSDVGKRVKLYCDAVIADEKARAQYWEEFLDEKSKRPNPHMLELFKGFSEERNIPTLGPDYEKFYNVVFSVFDKRDDKYSIQFFNQLWPSGDDLDFQLKKIEELRKLKPKNNQSWNKVLTNKTAELNHRLASYNKIMSKFLI
jgi:hypothetical protein